MVCADKGKISEATKRIEDLGKELGMIIFTSKYKRIFFCYVPENTQLSFRIFSFYFTT